jgi:hypothetical protein
MDNFIIILASPHPMWIFSIFCISDFSVENQSNSQELARWYHFDLPIDGEKSPRDLSQSFEMTNNLLTHEWLQINVLIIIGYMI